MAAKRNWKASLDETATKEHAKGLLEAFEKDTRLWATLGQLGGNDVAGKAACKLLLDSKALVHVGRVGRAEGYAACRGRSQPETLRALAERALVDLSTKESLVLLPVSPSSKFYDGKMPKKVRECIGKALQELVLHRQAFKAIISGKGFIALASNLRGLVGSANDAALQPGTNGQRPDLTSQVIHAGAALDPRTVLRAYEELSAEHRSPNVIIAELRHRARVELQALKDWLLAECRARRAVPLLGEPLHATAEQLEAALPVDGKPHLYVRFLRGEPA